MSGWIEHMESTIRANWARHIHESNSRICTDALVTSRYLMGIVATGTYMKDSTAPQPPHANRKQPPTVPFDAVEHALNERRRALTRARVERFRMEPEPREFGEVPAWKHAVKVRNAIGLWVAPNRMHARTTVRAVWYGRDRRISDIEVKKAREPRPLNFAPIAWKDIPVSHASQEDGASGPIIARRWPE